MIDDLIGLDTTGDGYDDSLLYFDENGGFVVASDLDYDGNFEQVQYFSGMDYWGNPTEAIIMIDTDNDGNLDTGFAESFNEFGDVVAHAEFNDYNQDGEIDMMKIYEDTTGAGQFDIVTSIHSDNSESPIIQKIDVQMDQTGDQKPDISIHTEILDSTGDNQPDLVKVTTTDSYGQEFSYEMSYEEYLAQEGSFGYTTSAYPINMLGAQFNPETADPNLVAGDPASDMQYWEYQGQTGRCALYAQKFAIEERLGREVPIEELVAVAEEHGWFNEAAGGGTTTLNMDKLLEYYGVDHQMSFDNDIDSLENALKNGNNVIVGVDSGQIWYGNENNIFSPETNADHAVQVIGIDRTNPDSPMVVLNDSGTPDGRGELVPLDVFENAWNAGDAQMIVC